MTTNNQKPGEFIAGIDYSMTSPSICMMPVESPNFKDCHIFFLTSRPKLAKTIDNIEGSLFREWTNDQERYSLSAEWVSSVIARFECRTVFIEGYSMGSTGRVFHIAENTAIAKDRVWSRGMEIVSIPPTTVKLFATGKGNSGKDILEVAFLKETNYDIRTKLSLTPKQSNPISDIIDSYYVAKCGLLNNLSRGK